MNYRNALIETRTRTAFAAATANVPKPKRTALYAMVRSALSRKVGANRPKHGWSVARESR